MERSQGKRLFILPVVSLGLHQKIIENTVVKRNQQLYSGKSLSNTNVRKREKKIKKKRELGILSVISWRKVKMWKWWSHHEVAALWKRSCLLGPGFPQGGQLLPAPGFGPTLPRSCSELLLWNPAGRGALCLSSVPQLCCARGSPASSHPPVNCKFEQSQNRTGFYWLNVAGNSWKITH